MNSSIKQNKNLGIFICLLAAFLISQGVLTDFEKLKTLLTPSAQFTIDPRLLNYFSQVINHNAEGDEKKLNQLLTYYARVSALLSERAASYGMRGLCYYHLKQFDQATHAYQEAIKSNPQCFWYYYNPGLIHFQLGHYREAIDLLKKALETSDERTLAHITHSQIVYGPMINPPPGINSYVALKTHLKEGKNVCYQYLILSYDRLGDYTSVFSLTTSGLKFHLIPKKEDGLFQYYAGVAALRLKKYKIAAAFLGKYLQANPYHREAYEYLFQAFSNLNQKKLALQIMKKTIYLEKKHLFSSPSDEPLPLSIY